MRLIRRDEVEPKAVPADEQGNPAEGTFVQILIPEGPNFVLRVFTITPGGHTPLHSHPREHEVCVLSGKGRAEGESPFDLALLRQHGCGRLPLHLRDTERGGLRVDGSRRSVSEGQGRRYRALFSNARSRAL